MSEKPTNSVEHFLRLYELQRGTLNARREIEWKVCISFWSAIIVGTGVLIQKIQLPCYSCWFYVLLFLVFSPLWLGKMFNSSEEDHNWIKVYKSHIHKSLDLQSETVKYQEVKWNTFLCSPWWISQMVMTAAVLFASWYLLTTTPIQLPK
jgi:hypothetical protein